MLCWLVFFGNKILLFPILQRFEDLLSFGLSTTAHSLSYLLQMPFLWSLISSYSAYKILLLKLSFFQLQCNTLILEFLHKASSLNSLVLF